MKGTTNQIDGTNQILFHCCVLCVCVCVCVSTTSSSNMLLRSKLTSTFSPAMDLSYPDFLKVRVNASEYVDLHPGRYQTACGQE